MASFSHLERLLIHVHNSLLAVGNMRHFILNCFFHISQQSAFASVDRLLVTVMLVLGCQG